MEPSASDPARRARAQELFEQIEDLAPAAQRARLDQECAGDGPLRQAVEALLLEDERALLDPMSAPEAADLLTHLQDRTPVEAVHQLLDELRAFRPATRRYRVEGELARGGMGCILAAWDPAIRRRLAMKVLQEPDPGAAPEAQTARLVRFFEEAQVTGQLDHPGIVSVHELGVDEDDCVYFTMPLVRGQDLSDILELCHDGREGWSTTRVLGVILRACEAMAYAHSKGVLHRDLKPSNIRVGRFGEVYVMDWGIARVMGKEDRHDLRLQVEGTQSLETERHHPRGEDSRLCTLDGRVVGTPYYMPLEQAEGRLEALGPHSDVYALGAMIYEAASGQRPYQREGATLSAHTVLAAVLDHPPRPLRECAPGVAPELISLCEKAMCRDIAGRYRDTRELAEDLRAYLEGRVVKAHAVGPIAELRKWVQRNRRVALAAAGALALVLGAVSFAWIRESQHSDQLSRSNESLSEARSTAEQRLQEVQRLADINELGRLRLVADALWPAWPSKVPQMEEWLAEADELVARLPLHQSLLGRLGAAPEPASEPHSEDLLANSLEADAPRREQWLPDLVRGFVRELQAFAEGEGEGSRAELRRRRDRALELRRRSIEDHAELWDEAITDVALDERFEGLEMDPQLGLVPLGPDPDSGLWEFAVLDSGSLPRRDEDDGALQLDEDFATVLILLPPANFLMGAQNQDPGAPRYEPTATMSVPMHEVRLEAFFIGKYELTQSQWERLCGERPSFYPLKGQPPSALIQVQWRRLPVEQVDHGAATQVLHRVGLCLPTEAQWEYAARAGSNERWWCGDEASSISERNAGNLYDQTSFKVRGDRLWGDPLPWSDGTAELAEVGRYAANDFGLHDTLGNLIEWCRDWYGSYDLPVAPGDGERQVPPAQRSHRIQRGGDFTGNTEGALSAYRERNTPDTSNFNLGLRASRPVLPDS